MKSFRIELLVPVPLNPEHSEHTAETSCFDSVLEILLS